MNSPALSDLILSHWPTTRRFGILGRVHQRRYPIASGGKACRIAPPFPASEPPMPTQRPLFKSVNRRHPFAIADLPFLARLYRAAYAQRRRLSKRFVGKPLKRVFGLLYHGFKMGGTGIFTLTVAGQRRPVPFNARNTQFAALYLPQNADGYESETAALIDVLCGNGACFIDVGANWGFYSLYLASRDGFQGTIHAIEPWPPTFGDLTRCIEAAGLADTIICHNVALSAEAGDATMGLPDGMQSGLARLSAGGADGETVTLTPLDALDLPVPHVIKIDVEGHEAAAIAGAKTILSMHHPFVVFESWNERKSPETTMTPFRALAELGYVFFLPAWSRADMGGRYAVADLPGMENILAVTPFTPELRFMLPDQINVLAVHRDRLDDLAVSFGA